MFVVFGRLVGLLEVAAAEALAGFFVVAGGRRLVGVGVVPRSEAEASVATGSVVMAGVEGSSCVAASAAAAGVSVAGGAAARFVVRRVVGVCFLARGRRLLGSAGVAAVSAASGVAAVSCSPLV